MLILIMQFDFVIIHMQCGIVMLGCSLHPATQYAMRHSDVQMTSFGTDHNSGSWLWRVILFRKVGSHDPILVQLSFQIFLRMMENVGVHTIQFSHPIIS